MAVEIPCFCIIRQLAHQVIAIRHQGLRIPLPGGVAGNHPVSAVGYGAVVCVQQLGSEIRIGFHEILRIRPEGFILILALHPVSAGDGIPDKLDGQGLFRRRSAGGCQRIRSGDMEIPYTDGTVVRLRQVDHLHRCVANRITGKQLKLCFRFTHQAIAKQFSIHIYRIPGTVFLISCYAAVPCQRQLRRCTGHGKFSSGTALHQPGGVPLPQGPAHQLGGLLRNGNVRFPDLAGLGCLQHLSAQPHQVKAIDCPVFVQILSLGKCILLNQCLLQGSHIGCIRCKSGDACQRQQQCACHSKRSPFLFAVVHVFILPVF